MGAALSVTNNKVVQDMRNETFQSARNSCTADCNQSISGNTIVLDNSRAGNITFTQKCTANANCYMNNAVDAEVSVLQDLLVNASASPSFFPGIQVNSTSNDTTQTLKNEITQVLENICQASVNQDINNNIVYATNSTLEDVGFVQDGNAAADCIMENSARMKLNLQQKGDITARSGGGFSIGAGIIAIIIIVIIIGIVSRAIKKNGSEQADPNAVGSQRMNSMSNMGNQQARTQPTATAARSSTTRTTRTRAATIRRK